MLWFISSFYFLSQMIVLVRNSMFVRNFKMLMLIVLKILFLLAVIMINRVFFFLVKIHLVNNWNVWVSLVSVYELWSLGPQIQYYTSSHAFRPFELLFPTCYVMNRNSCKVYFFFNYMQAAIRPPTFVFFVNDAKLFPETYRRYMEKQLRTDAGFSGTPIRLLWRSRRKLETSGG